jgi:hypothetical protein
VRERPELQEVLRAPDDVDSSPCDIDRAEVDALSNGLIQVVERFKGEPAVDHVTMREVVRSEAAALATRLLSALADVGLR